MKRSPHLDIDKMSLDIKNLAQHETPEYIQARIQEVLQDTLSTHISQQQSIAQLQEALTSTTLKDKRLLSDKLLSEIEPNILSFKNVNSEFQTALGSFSSADMLSSGPQEKDAIRESGLQGILQRAIQAKISEIDTKLENAPENMQLLEEKVYWSTILLELQMGESLQKFYKQPSHERFTRLYDTVMATKTLDLEQYRPLLLKQFEKIAENTENENFTSKQQEHLLKLKKLLQGSLSLESLLESHPELINFLSLLDISFIDTFESIGTLVYPKLNTIYSQVRNIDYAANIGVEAIYALYKSNNNVLDEVVVYAKSNHVIDIGKHTIGQHTIHPSHIIEFLTHFKHQRNISFKEVSTVKDQKYPLLMYDRMSKRIPYLDVVLDGYSMASVVNVSKVLSNRIDLDPVNYTFNIESKGLLITTKFEYSLVIPDKEGNELIRFETSNYEVFEELFANIGYQVPSSQKEQIIKQFKAVIGQEKDKNVIDAYYNSLPSFLYLDKEGFRLEGENALLDDDALIRDLKEILEGSVNDSGSNEERAIVNIIKAISYDELYRLLYNKTELLYQIFDQLDGDEYNEFVAYLTAIVKYRKNQKPKGTAKFSNEYWIWRDIHLKSDDWTGGKTIQFTNYKIQKTTEFGDDGRGGSIESVKSEEVSLGKIPPCHPLDLIKLETQFAENGEKPTMEVLAFELHNKVKKQTYWDWFNITTDIIGIITIVGGTYSLVAKGATIGVRAIGVGAGVAKEISSILIQNKELTTWLKKEYPEVYKIWFALDTTGNVIYGVMALPQLVKFTSKGSKAVAGATLKGYKEAKVLSRNLALAIKKLYARLRLIQLDIAKTTKQYLELEKVLQEAKKGLASLQNPKIKWNTGTYKFIKDIDQNLTKFSKLKEDSEVIDDVLVKLKLAEKEIDGTSEIQQIIKTQIVNAEKLKVNIANQIKGLEQGKSSLNNIINKRLNQIISQSERATGQLEKIGVSNLKWSDKTKKIISDLEDKLDELYNAETLLFGLSQKTKKILDLESKIVQTRKKYQETIKSLQNKFSDQIRLEKQQRVRDIATFRKENVQIQRIEKGLEKARKRYLDENGLIDYKKIQRIWNSNPKIKLGELSKFDVVKLMRYRKKGMNIAQGELEVWYNGKKIFSKKDYIASSGKKDKIPMAKGSQRSKETLTKRQMEDVEKNFANRTDDSEVKISAAMDEDIAKAITKLSGDKAFDPKNLKINKKINSTYDPCNVCKKELLSRQDFYKATLEINRPFFNNPKKGLIPVRTGTEFDIYLKQNKIVPKL